MVSLCVATHVLPMPPQLLSAAHGLPIDPRLHEGQRAGARASQTSGLGLLWYPKQMDSARWDKNSKQLPNGRPHVWASGRTCMFLHMLVMCLLPRAEGIQKPPGNRPAPSPGKPVHSGSSWGPASCVPVGKRGHWGPVKAGSSRPLRPGPLHGQEDAGPGGPSYLLSGCCGGAVGPDWTQCSLLSILGEGLEGESAALSCELRARPL